MSLAFGDDINFSVSNRIRFSRGGGEKPRVASPEAADEALMELIGRRVVGARLVGRDQLVVDLDEGFIELTDDLAMFECIVVTTRDRVDVI